MTLQIQIQKAITYDLVLWLSFATFCWKETNEIEIGDW